MSVNENYVGIMNSKISKLTKDAIKVSLKRPAFTKFIIKYFAWQKKAEKIRNDLREEGYVTPPFLIASITKKCNLNCKGCYSKVNNKNGKELTNSKWIEIFNEAKEMGVSFILIAGGEPFIRLDLLKMAGEVPEIIFPIFTNGTYIEEDALNLLERNRNLIPIISIEGFEGETDDRRGVGIHKKVIKSMELFNKKDIFYGTSITVTSKNFNLVTSENFINEMIERGSKVFFYVEYVPFDEKTKDLEITQTQREELLDRLDYLKTVKDALFISFPGDESKLGGCLSSGRGFVHINPLGDLEPCPFSPYSDVNLNDVSLQDGLKSKFLKSIRENDEELSETEHGCALFNKKDWVLTLLNKN